MWSTADRLLIAACHLLHPSQMAHGIPTLNIGPVQAPFWLRGSSLAGLAWTVVCTCIQCGHLLLPLLLQGPG